MCPWSKQQKKICFVLADVADAADVPFAASSYKQHSPSPKKLAAVREAAFPNQFEKKVLKAINVVKKNMAFVKLKEQKSICQAV